MNRCVTCDKVVATPEDYKNIPEGEGEHLCWSEYSKWGCEPEDWRSRALAAEREAAEMKAYAKELELNFRRVVAERDAARAELTRRAKT